MKKISNLGGGANSSLTNKNTTSVFKPLIASSLALALGVSVASATNPTLCFDSATCTADQSSSVGIKWGNIDNGTIGSATSQKFYQPQTTSSAVIENLVINLGGNNANNTSGTTHTITTGTKFLKLDSGDRGIQLGASGGGTLRINTGGDDGLTHNTNTTLVFNKETSSKYALYGNLEIWGAKDTTHNYTTAQFNDPNSGAMNFNALSTFSVTFNGDLKGDLIVRNQNYRNDNNNGTEGTITFENGAGIDGNLKLTHDGIKKYEKVLGVGLTQGEHTITFTQSGSSTTSITGDLILEFGKNTIDFHNNTTIGGKIDAGVIGNGNTDIDESYGGEPTQVNRISQNTITFYGTSNISGKSDGTTTTAISASGGSSNTIDFRGRATIGGNIFTSSSALGGAGINSLTFSDATINGKIWGNGGENYIYFNSGAGSINGEVSVVNGGNVSGKNYVVFNGDSSQFGTSGKKSNITVKFSLADNGSTYSAIGSNTIIANASTSNSFALEKIALDGNYSSGNKADEKTFIILSFNKDSKTTTNSLTADLMTANYGSNIIGKNIATETSKKITYDTNLFDTTSGLIGKENFATTFMGGTTYQASGTYTFGAKNNQSEAILAGQGGNNYINVATLNVNGNIKTQGGGNNYIKSNALTLIGNIETGNGKNYIINSGALGITGSIKTTGGGGYNYVSNSGALTVSESIETNNGKNEIIINNGGSLTVTTKVMANSSGKNEIKLNTSTASNIGVVSALSFGSNIINSTGSGNLTVGQITIEQTPPTYAVLTKSINTVTFAGTTLTVSNGIATKGYYGSSGYNEINLTKANATLAVTDKGITLRKGNHQDSGDYHEENRITFTDGGTITLSGSGNNTEDATFNFGGILARDNANKNIITFNGTSDATIQGAYNQSATKYNATNIRAQRGGINEITFKGTGTSTINANVSTNGGTNTITASSSVLNLLGDITSEGGTNTIKATSKAFNFGGNIIANGGTNTITTANWVSSGSSSNKISARGANINIKATTGTAVFAGVSTFKWSGGAKVGNTIDLGSGSVTINARSGETEAEYTDINNKAIYANNAGNSNSIKAGTIIVNGAIYAGSESSNSLETTTLTLTNVAISAKNGATNTITATSTSTTATIAGISTSEYNALRTGNTINLGSGSVTINARSGETVDTKYNDKAIYAENEGNSNSVTANSISVTAQMFANNQGINSLTASSSIAVTGNITTTSGGQNNFTLTADSATLTLNGNANSGTSHTITSLTATSSGTNTLTLDNSTTTNGAMTTTIHSVSNGENLAVVLNGQDNKSVTLTFDNANGTTLKSVALHTNATTTNALAFGAGSNKIIGGISVGASKKLTLNLSGSNTSLNLVGGLSKGSGNADIVVNGSNLSLNGETIEATNLTFAGASTLAINNSSASFTNISVDAGSSTLAGIALSGGSNLTFADRTALTLNNAGDTFTTVNASGVTNGATLTIGAGNTTTINTLNDGGSSHTGSKLTVGFNGNASANAKLIILDSDTSDKQIKLNGVSVESNSTHNTLDLSSLRTVEIGNAVSLDQGRGLTLKLKDTNLKVTGGTDSRLTETEAKGALTISVDSGVGSTSTATSSLKATSGSLNITSLDMVGDGKTTVTFLSDATIGNLTAQADNGSNLVVGNASDKDPQHPQTIAYSLTINTTNSTLDSVTLEGGDTTTLAINGGTQTINTLTLNASKNELTLSNKDNLTIGKIDDKSNTFSVTLTDSTLSLAGDTNKIDSLVTDGKSVINLAVGRNGTNKARSADPKLTIGKLEGDLKANILVSKTQADQIKINDATNANSNADTLTLYARGSASEIISITRGDNILVADTSEALTKSKTVNVVGGTSDLGGLVVQLNVEQDDQTAGMWYVGKTEVKGVDESFQEVASSALAVNYDLYLANFNSLNKRMGELRDNPYNQGVWARVFGGAMSNDIGSGTKTNYVTAQAGYDYSLTLGDARNYMGIAVAYGSSWTKANEGVGLTTATLDNINSKMAEVGIYNSYVADNGWYNDTIFKFDYIMSDFDISVQSGGTSTHSTNNFAMVLSDEFGYRYKFAENEKGNWYIDPQVEMAFGYFNQSDFNQAIANNFTTVEASQDAILTLRTRAGMSLGKKFISAKGFATLYVGAFYEYDYIDGGNAQAQVLSVSNSLDRLESNGRAIVNIGSNIELTDGVRMYIDVEKSFGDKQRTDMQFNFGARYSFGDKTPSTSYLADEKKRSTAPLKVEEKPQAQESKTEAPANTEAKQ